MHVTIILNEPYPSMYACTNRIYYYAKGLSERGASVKVYVHKPTEKESEKIINRFPAGYYKGTYYEYPSRMTIRSESLLIRSYYDIKGIILTCFKLLRSRFANDAIFLVSNNLFHVLLYKLIAIFCGSIYLTEISERNSISKKKSFIINLYMRFYEKYIYKLFDGIFFFISTRSENNVQNWIRKRTKLLSVPILVDNSEFDEVTLPAREKPFMLVSYCSWNQNMDGIIRLLKTFSLLRKTNPNVELYLLGNPIPEYEKKKIHVLLEQFEIQEYVKFTFNESKRDLITLMCEADLLLLEESSCDLDFNNCQANIFAKYLATGKPTLLSKVGSLSSFIVDGVNGFLVESDNEESYAKKIQFIINNYEMAKQVGKIGKQLAVNIFDYRMNVQRISAFMKDIIQTKLSQPIYSNLDRIVK